jgi:hypothetical protein
MINIEEIVVGWKNYFIKNPKVEPVAKRRFEICYDCEHLRKKNNTCGKCGCYMVAKVRNLGSRCPINKW